MRQKPEQTKNTGEIVGRLQGIRAELVKLKSSLD